MLFHKTILDFSGGVRQGLRSSPWLSLRSPVGAGLDRPIGLCKLSPTASAPGGAATESQPLLRETELDPRRRPINQRIADLETSLNDFAPAVRAQALAELVALAQQGVFPLKPEADAANMHCHTFFSFNAYGHSPTSLAWLAKRRGFRLMGIVDFDVLDGVDEFLDACELVGVRGSAGIETRVFLPEFATREINSPGEPGVYYHMGIGFTSSQVPEAAAGILDDLRQRTARRNRGMADRVNAHLAPVEEKESS